MQNYRLKKDWSSAKGLDLKKGTVVTQRNRDIDRTSAVVVCLAPGQIEVEIPREALDQIEETPSEEPAETS